LHTPSTRFDITDPADLVAQAWAEAISWSSPASQERKFKLATFYFYEHYVLLLAKLITMSVKINFTDKNYFYIIQFNYTE
jgi:hypothetical protein